MAASFQLEIVTPTRVIDCGSVDYLRMPSGDGLFGVMAQHVRAMASLDVGEIKYLKGGKAYYYATNGGYADIRGNNVQLLVEAAEVARQIDVDRAKSAEQRARKRLREQARDRTIDEARASTALQRALNRLGVAERG